jgi:hypothetical protein
MENSEKKPTERKADGLLAATARVIGKAAGAVASTVGVRENIPASSTAPVSKPGKLPNRNKTRLPRRDKKALQKKQLATQKRSSAA